MVAAAESSSTSAELPAPVTTANNSSAGPARDKENRLAVVEECIRTSISGLSTRLNFTARNSTTSLGHGGPDAAAGPVVVRPTFDVQDLEKLDPIIYREGPPPRWAESAGAVAPGMPVALAASIRKASMEVPRPPKPPAPDLSRPRVFQTLPPEIHMLVISHLDLASISNMHQVNKYFRGLCSPDMIRVILGADAVREMLRSHCCECFKSDPSKKNLLAGLPGDEHLFTAKCFPCARRTGDERVAWRNMGHLLELGDGSKTRLCRWCGGTSIGPAIARTRAMRNHRMGHTSCSRHLRYAWWFFMLLGLAQFLIVMVGSSLAWRYFKDVQMVLGPTVTSFLLTWLCFIVLLVREPFTRSYRFAFWLEMTILCMWIPPLYYVGQILASNGPADVPMSTMVTTVFFGMNATFRLFNTIGNFAMWREYDWSRQWQPGRWWWNRWLIDPAIRGFIFWTWPSYLCQEWQRPELEGD